MKPRRISRELALLSVSQLSDKPKKSVEELDVQDLVVAATRTLTGEVRDTLEVASSELERGNSRLLSSETQAADFQSAKVMVSEAIALAQSSINRLGTAVEIPEILQGATQKDVADYAVYIITTLLKERDAIDAQLNEVMENWTMNRLARIDQDILRIAVTEIVYLELSHRVAIDEAVELAKRYSEKDGHRFINGVLRRVSDRLSAQKRASSR
ncbi:MAG: transcription antitermination protein NusB [Merismopedia sp. SIO2A8]|nr:transcription antitermination protein NusB [Symploca sp. SIO2B6]NET51841.1 transcription antitermination protein NusB [Merismopedia sp. SIO2A8]